jgi:hypothetical protein
MAWSEGQLANEGEKESEGGPKEASAPFRYNYYITN